MTVANEVVDPKLRADAESVFEAIFKTVHHFEGKVRVEAPINAAIMLLAWLMINEREYLRMDNVQKTLLETVDVLLNSSRQH